MRVRVRTAFRAHCRSHIGCGLPTTEGGRMPTAVMRGSEKVMAAWNARMLSEESISEIAKQLEESHATIESADVVGGEHPTGLRVSLRYDGEDGPWCGNDILFWL